MEPASSPVRPPAGHLDFLDSLRGTAILAVACYHVLWGAFGFDQPRWNGLWRELTVPCSFFLVFPAWFGFLGVAVFFAVSGFCIHLSHSRSTSPGFGVFFLRRFCRIYPPYLACLCLFSFVYPWAVVDFRQFYWAAQFGSHLSLLHNFGAKSFYGLNPSFWSIAVEFQLYLLYPILWWHARRHGWLKTLAATAVVELLVRGASAAHIMVYPDTVLPRWATDNPFAYWFSWCVGATCADEYLSGRLWPALRLRSLLALLGAIVAAYFLKPAAVFMFPLAALLTAGVITACLARRDAFLRPGMLASPLRVLSALGVVSYSFYLVHQPLLELVTRLLRSASPDYPPLLGFAGGLLALIPVYFVSKALYLGLERPSIAAGKRLVNRLRPNH